MSEAGKVYLPGIDSTRLQSIKDKHLRMDKEIFWNELDVKPGSVHGDRACLLGIIDLYQAALEEAQQTELYKSHDQLREQNARLLVKNNSLQRERDEAQEQDVFMRGVAENIASELKKRDQQLAEAQQTIAALEMVREEERGYHERDCIEYQQTIARQGEIIHGIDRDLTKLRLALIAIAGIDIIGSSAITMKAIAQEALGEGAKEEWEFQIKPRDKVLVNFRHLKGQELPVSANHAHKRLISVIAPDGLWNVAYGDFEKAGEGAKES